MPMDYELEYHELEAVFELRHAADMRAVRLWRIAHPGNELVIPDHADMVVWLIDELEHTQESIFELQERVGELEESSNGERFPVKTCTACGGSGVYDNVGSPPCGACNGTGWS